MSSLSEGHSLRHAGEHVSPRFASWLLLRLRWRSVRNPIFRWGLIFGLLFVLFAVWGSSNAGYSIALAAQLGDGSAANIYAIAWVQSLNYGTLGLGSLAVAGAVLISVFAPFTGTSITGLAPSDDLATLRPPVQHRFYDALLINTVSGMGLLQLVVLTTVTSVIVLDGSRLWAMLATWLFWFILVILTTTIGFTLEWFQRKWGKRTRRILGVALLLGLSAAVGLDPNRGRTLFGTADYYTELMRLSVTETHPGSVILVAVLVVVALLGISGGRAVTSAALGLPPRRSNGGKEHTRSIPAGRDGSAFSVATRLIAKAVWRTKESRTPILAITLLGFPAVAFASMSESLQVALPITVPLAVALGWGVNLFGLLGGGMNWLGSQPKILSMLPNAAFFTQTVLSFTILAGLLVVSYSRGNTAGAQLFWLVVVSFIVSVSTSALSVLLSVATPKRAPLTGSGDAIIPPMSAIIYLIVLVTVGCLPGVLILGMTTPSVQALLSVTIVVVSLGVVALANRVWKSPVKRTKTIAEVAF